MAITANSTSVIISAVVGCLAALVTCLAFFYFIFKPAQQVDAQPPATPPTTPLTTPGQLVPNPEIKAADVSSISLETVYRGYFEPGNRCAKTYDDYFGNTDGFFSSSSPCTIKISLNRGGAATRSIELSRWDKNTKKKAVIERSEWTATVPPKQFEALAEAVTSNQAFKSWREGTMINVSNCSIKVVYPGGVKTVMSNVDDRTTAYLPMLDALKKLDGELDWKLGRHGSTAANK